MFTQCRRFLSRGIPETSARLLQKQKRILKQPLVGQFQLDAVIRYGHVCHAPQRGKEVSFRQRVVNGPPGLTASMRATAANRGIDDSRHMELALGKVLD